MDISWAGRVRAVLLKLKPDELGQFGTHRPALHLRKWLQLKLNMESKPVGLAGWAAPLGQKLTPDGTGRWRVRSVDISWAGRDRAVLLKLKLVELGRLGAFRFVLNLAVALKLKLRPIELWPRF